MIAAIKRILTRRNDQQEGVWLEGKAIDRTLGSGHTLANPVVNQPTREQLKGKQLSLLPSYIAMEVTNACNLKCKHCNYRYGLEHYTRDRGFMSWEIFEKALAEAKENNISVLMNYDGEPLMHPDYLKFLERATEMGINTYFNTNGTLFDNAFADRLVTFYKGSIFFSIDGDKDWFEKIRTPAKYDHVVNNVDYFLSINEAAGWPITVGASLCNLGQTADERKRFLEHWLPKVNYVSMGEVNDKFGTMISEPMTLFKAKKRPRCAVPWETCGICHNGDVIPCSIYVTRANTADAIFGNIGKQSLREIWSGELFNRFRRMISSEQYEQSYCDKCHRWLSQFSFPIETKQGITVERNGFWTTFQNIEKGKLNFRK